MMALQKLGVKITQKKAEDLEKSLK
jgi:hypothetical protein